MMKFAHLSAAALTVTLAVASPAVGQDIQTEKVDRTVSLPANGQLRLKNFSGKITITGTNRADVTIHAIRRAPREQLDHIKLDVLQTGSGVSIEANKKDENWHNRNNNVVDTQFNIEVPDDATLDIESCSSDVQIVDVRGRQRLHTFSGDVDVSGTAGPIDVETFSGGITVKLASGAGGRVDFDSFSGSIDTDVPMMFKSGSRRSVHGEIGAGGSNDFHFKTFSGDVRIR
jgi:hypothetical protein